MPNRRISPRCRRIAVDQLGREVGLQRDERQGVTEKVVQVASDALASEWYRREIAPVHLKRVLLGKV